jgi:hypothetical protein
VQAAVEQIRAAGASAAKPVMISALDAADGRALYERGFQLIAVGAAGLVATSGRTFLKETGRS